MNPMIKAAIGGVVRTVAPFLVAKGIDLPDDQLEMAIQTAVVVVCGLWSVWQKTRVDRKIRKVAATGVI